MKEAERRLPSYDPSDWDDLQLCLMTWQPQFEKQLTCVVPEESFSTRIERLIKAPDSQELVLSFRMVITMSYYGLVLNTTNLHGNPFLNFFLSAVVEVPAFIIAMLLLRYCSRRFCQSSTLLMGGAVIFIIQLIPKGKTFTGHILHHIIW